MRKAIIVFLFCFLILANCEQKREQRAQTPMPKGNIQTQNEIEFLKNAVRQNPKDLNAWIELGNILMDTGRYREAIDSYQKALELDPKNVDVRVDMGTCYRNIGNPNMAVEEFRKAIKINPKHLYAHRNLGAVLLNDFADKKQAIKEFEEYVKLSPDTPDAQMVKQEIARLKASK
jgi:cytochrome c-type biogenesis protein CcmH/NrfG